MKDIDFKSLYGIKENENDFSGAIKRALSKPVQHISEGFYKVIQEIRDERKKYESARIN